MPPHPTHHLFIFLKLLIKPAHPILQHRCVPSLHHHLTQTPTPNMCNTTHVPSTPHRLQYRHVQPTMFKVGRNDIVGVTVTIHTSFTVIVARNQNHHNIAKYQRKNQRDMLPPHSGKANC
ncbi:hypothetical protein JHK82_019443 [Glycine max]|nr:hypothetical protein JHK85_019884 [Glycine max]KAG5038618.1 hypothetical protein JHK86_019458 [Glycine max]KAG5143748.1 hypothetical protein JHK82_019443 [Glycine max]